MIKHNGKVLFTEQELKCKGTGQLKLAPGFAERLQILRITFGQPMQVNSCCRAPSHNQAVGGHPRSLHLTEGGRETGGACAIDINTRGKSPGYAAQLAMTALQLGWSVGVHPGFLHLDLRQDYTDLPQNIFNY